MSRFPESYPGSEIMESMFSDVEEAGVKNS